VATLPDVPTFKELGLDPVNRMAFYGILAPKGTPKDVVDKVYAAAKAALADPTVKSRIEATGSVVIGNTPAEFERQIREELGVYREVVKKQQLKLDS
jgi:tripartite-type tricarboxylate transporter receptor subunit TctC